MSNNDKNLVSDIGQAVRADPKKAGLLSLLAVVLLGIVGRMMMNGGRSGPSNASASSSLRGTASDARNNSASSQHNSSAISSALRKWSEGNVPAPSRNLFAVRIEYFPMNDSR